MAQTEYSGINLAFRPTSYFWPLGLETHLLARIKGAERKKALKRLIAEGHLDDIPGFLVESALSSDERTALGRIHPALMGGEYLPDLLETEVMVARVVIASTTQDVICVYARRNKRRIHYRVVDEYQGNTLSERKTRTSIRPLTLGQLEAFFNGTWSIFNCLEGNFSYEGYDINRMQKFVLAVESEFYPDFGNLYRRRIAAWVAAHQSDDEGPLEDGSSSPEVQP